MAGNSLSLSKKIKCMIRPIVAIRKVRLDIQGALCELTNPTQLSAPPTRLSIFRLATQRDFTQAPSAGPTILCYVSVVASLAPSSSKLDKCMAGDHFGT